MCIARDQATPAKLLKLMNKVQESLAREAGVFRRLDNLGMRPLAYRIKAHGKWNEYGRYMRLRVQASPHCLKEVETRLTDDENVVRIMTLRMPFAPQTPPSSSTKDLKRLEKKVEKSKDKGGHVDNMDVSAFMQRYKTLDFYASQALYQAGIISAEELEKLPRWGKKSSREVVLFCLVFSLQPLYH